MAKSKVEKVKGVTASDFVRHLKALGAGRMTTIVPCPVYHPKDCGNCALYISEGSMEWIYQKSLETLPVHHRKVNGRKTDTNHR